MKSVCIQVGHWQCESLTAKGLRGWRDVALLRKSTGASGERDYHWHKVMPILRDLLIERGIQVYITSSVWDEIYNRDFDLWVSLHYDGGGSENRCIISAPTREAVPAFLNEKAQREAERFCAVWKSIYPEITKTINRDNRITEGMLWYYCFDYVPVNTPAVIIEHFNHTSDKGAELKQKPELVAQGDFKAILQFLDIPEKDPEEEIDKFEQYKKEKQEEIKKLKISHLEYKTENEKVILGLEGKITNLKKEVKNQRETIKQIKTENPMLENYSWRDLIGLGIMKLLRGGEKL